MATTRGKAFPQGGGSSNAYPRYTTYPTGELGEALRRLNPTDAPPLPVNAEEMQRGIGVQHRSSPIVKGHDFAATFPDGTEGTCHYERLGPAFHRFDFTDADGHKMPRQWHTKRLDGTSADIERTGKEIAEAAFRDAIEQERRDYFCRASEPGDGSRKKRLDRFQMSAKRAKELAGRYALCLRLGIKLLPMAGETFAKLDEANAAWWKWREELPGVPDYRTSPVVGCCNRLDRCWEIPRYNPLYSETGKPEQGGK